MLSNKAKDTAAKTHKKLMDKYSVQLEEVENNLADSAIYEHAEKVRLTTLLKSQAEIKDALEEAEIEWMDAQETIEIMQTEFAAAI